MGHIVLIDDNDNVLGTIPYEEAHKKGLPHRVSVVYLYNDKGEILVQHRDDGRLDHSSAGHVDPGEDYLQAAKRELFEELGVENVSLEEFAKALNIENRSNGDNIKHQYAIYKCKAQPGKINEAEVQKVYWAKPEEILSDMEKDPDNVKYTKGFKVSIKHYLKNL